MGKSLKDYISAFGYWGIIVIAPIFLDIIGIYQLASGNTFTGVPSWVWFQIIFLFLLIIPFIAFHKTRQKLEVKENELHQLKSQRPIIKTKVTRELRDIDIEVENIGASAEFEVQAEILTGETFAVSLPRNYYPYWGKTNSFKTQLGNRGKDWIKIASLETDSPIGLFGYTLHYFQTQYKAVASTRSTAWTSYNDGDIKPQIQLRIIISSKPEMINGSTIKYYELNDKGLFEISSQ
jgi:hypothetical protein